MSRVTSGRDPAPVLVRGRGLAVVLVAVLLAWLAMLPAQADSEQVISGEHLRLVSVTSAEMASLAPGRAATWDVGISVTTPGEATVQVSLRTLTATEGAFAMDVTRCDERWTTSGCPAGEVPLLIAQVRSGQDATLGSIDADGAWYRVTVTMLGDADAARASLRLVADGVGEEVSAGTAPDMPAPAPLPGTGAAVLGQLLLAAAAVLAGLGLASLARRFRGSVS